MQRVSYKKKYQKGGDKSRSRSRSVKAIRKTTYKQPQTELKRKTLELRVIKSEDTYKALLKGHMWLNMDPWNYNDSDALAPNTMEPIRIDRGANLDERVGNKINITGFYFQCQINQLNAPNNVEQDNQFMRYTVLEYLPQALTIPDRNYQPPGFFVGGHQSIVTYNQPIDYDQLKYNFKIVEQKRFVINNFVARHNGFLDKSVIDIKFSKKFQKPICTDFVSQAAAEHTDLHNSRYEQSGTRFGIYVEIFCTRRSQADIENHGNLGFCSKQLRFHYTDL